MKIWLTRHGQTDLNKDRRMQGRSDIPLNETGLNQAKTVRAQITEQYPDLVFDADFGRYEKKKYYLLGPRMTLYWACPEIFPAPPTVETTAEMVARARSFLNDLREKDYENVLIACHGGIIRVLRGCLENRPRGYRWRPKPLNCEMNIYEI